jgi:CRP-like cAMP-binding protein
MKNPMHMRADRLLVAHLIVSLVKQLHKSIFTDAVTNFGKEVDAVFVVCCVSIGHAENKPMTASDISHYLGIRRTTVQRKLDELMKMDIVVRHGTRYWLSPDRLKNADKYITEATKIIGHAQRHVKIAA